MDDPRKKLRVVIVGGSVAGLTLANALAKTEIDFVVLESRAEIAPQVGASIGILPNGGRILDQLGMFDDTLKTVEPLRENLVWTSEAKPIMHSNSPVIIHERHGYPVSFLDRQTLLQVLYDHLKAEGQARVHTNKKVIEVEHLPTKVVARCSDGSVFEGDVLVGADGIRSTVRQEMWRHLEVKGLGEEVLKEKTKMVAEYNCMFGISTATPGFLPGESHRTYAKDYSFLTFIGQEGRVYWFFFTKMDKVYRASDIPRYTKEDVDNHLAKYLDTQLTPTVKLADVHSRSITTCLVPLEEAFYQYWCTDRIVCIGDSVHKMTPNMGQGGNAAIESAALLANRLVKLVGNSSDGKISPSDISHCLHQWQKDREHRARLIWASANELTRLEACATFKHQFIGYHVLPRIQRYLLNKQSRLMADAEKLDFLPLPPRSLECSIPYTSPRRPAADTGLLKRALWTTPLVGCYRIGQVTLGGAIDSLIPHFAPFYAHEPFTASNGEVIHWMQPIFNNDILDQITQPLVLCFLPSISGSHPAGRAQMISFMADLAPIYAIWLLESYRKAHSGAEVLFPTLMGAAFQVQGIGKIAPLYYIIEYIRTPLSTLLSGATPANKKHEMKSAALKSLLPVLLVAYYLPTFASLFAPTVAQRRISNVIWQFFPLLVPLLQAPIRILARMLNPNPNPNPRAASKSRSKSKETEDTKQNRSQNLWYLRFTYLSLAAISAVSFLYVRHVAAPEGTSLLRVFFPSVDAYRLPAKSFADAIGVFMQYDEVVAMASSFVWLALRFREVKINGGRFSWWKAVGAGVAATLGVGPGAAIALGWGWREEMVAGLAGERE